MKKLIILLIILLPFTSFADEIITGFEEEDLPVVNEEFRKIRKDIENDVLWEKDDDDVELKIADDIDFQQKEAQQLVIENLTSDPSSPVEGQLWYRSDL